MPAQELTVADYDALTLAFWLARFPGADEVTVTIRSDGRVRGFREITAAGGVDLSPDAIDEALTVS